MPPRRANCQICNDCESKYACPKCEILYCSVSCYKSHKQNSCTGRGEPVPAGSFKSPPLCENVEDPRQFARSAAQLEPSDSSPDLDKVEQPSVSNPSITLDASSSQNTEDVQGRHREGDDNRTEETVHEKKVPLRALTTLKWPYIPEAPSYPDPLARDDPKPLSLAQYENIATSPAIRKALVQNPNLPRILRALDSLRGTQREETLQRILGVSRNAQGIAVSQRRVYIPLPTAASEDTSGAPEQVEFVDEEEMTALKSLAEAIEKAVHSGADKPDSVPIGLEWVDSGGR